MAAGAPGGPQRPPGAQLGGPGPYANGMQHAAGQHAGNGQRAGFGGAGAGARSSSAPPPRMALPGNMGAGPEGPAFLAALPAHAGLAGMPAGYQPMQVPYALLPGQNMGAMQARRPPGRVLEHFFCQRALRHHPQHSVMSAVKRT